MGCKHQTYWHRAEPRIKLLKPTTIRFNVQKKVSCLRVHINNNAFQVVPSSQYETTAPGQNEEILHFDHWQELMSGFQDQNHPAGDFLETMWRTQGWITRHHLNSSAILG
jgi:hypothetical protein